MKACVLALSLLPGLAFAQACEVAALIGNARSGDAVLKLGSSVAAGAELQTGPDSRLRLRCRDGSSLVMAANSKLRIEAFELQPNGQRAEARFHLSLGVIGQKVSGGGAWNVRTPSAVTAVRGTEYVIEVTEDKTAVLMQSGSVDVKPAAPQSRSLAAALPLIALAGALGTDCAQGKCTPAGPWSAERVKNTLDKLSGV